jgi:hypothetical protein
LDLNSPADDIGLAFPTAGAGPVIEVGLAIRISLAGTPLAPGLLAWLPISTVVLDRGRRDEDEEVEDEEEDVDVLARGGANPKRLPN